MKASEHVAAARTLLAVASKEPELTVVEAATLALAHVALATYLKEHTRESGA